MNSRLEKCCDVCGRSFAPRGSAKRCNLECRQTAKSARRDSYRQKSRKNKMCRWCGTELLKGIAYCSDDCRAMGAKWNRRVRAAQPHVRARIIQGKKNYWQKNLDKCHQRARQYRQENLDRIKQKQRQYRQENRDKINQKAWVRRAVDPAYRERLRSQRNKYYDRAKLALHIAHNLGLIEQRIVLSDDKDKCRSQRAARQAAYRAAHYKKHKDKYAAYNAAYKDKRRVNDAVIRDRYALAKELCFNLGIQLETKGETNDSSSRHL